MFNCQFTCDIDNKILSRTIYWTNEKAVQDKYKIQTKYLGNKAMSSFL